MAGTTDLSAVIQLQSSVPNAQALQSLRHWQANTETGAEKDNGKVAAKDQEKALDVAKQFEALLIHSMLKSMRKTTMSEGKSNQRAMYDDMLDQQMATTLVESGGIGVAESLLPQLTGNIPVPGKATNASTGVGSLPTGDVSQEKQSKRKTLGLSANDLFRLRQFANGATVTSEISPSKQQQFINRLQTHAQTAAESLGVNPNVVLAIAALETGWGQHMLKDTAGNSTHNYFGIKAHNIDDKFTENTTTEFFGNTPRKVNDKFVAYNNAADGFKGFAEFVLNNPRYSKALEHASDSSKFIKELHQAGYATDPNYSQKALTVLKQIEQETLPL